MPGDLPNPGTEPMSLAFLPLVIKSIGVPGTEGR